MIAIPPMPEPVREHLPEIMLAMLAVIPPAIAWMLGFFGSSAAKEKMRIVTRPLSLDADPEAEPPVTACLLHLSRTQSAAELRDLAVGLRHQPVEQAAPLLRHFMRSPDPELSLYAQSLLQAEAESLRSQFGNLQASARSGNSRAAATVIESGLRLASAALCAQDERDQRLRELSVLADELAAKLPRTPRLAAACEAVRSARAAGRPAPPAIQRAAAPA